MDDLGIFHFKKASFHEGIEGPVDKFPEHFMTKHQNFLFIHRVGAFTLLVSDSDNTKLFRGQLLPKVSIYHSADSFGE